jgi:hypothetical protein
LPAKEPKAKTTREQLAAELKPLLPRTWKIIPYARNLDDANQTRVMLHATDIHPAPAMGALETDYTITVISPKADPTGAQTDLDDDVLNVLHALDGITWLMFRNASPTVVQDYLSWDINITVITRKDA